MSPVTRLNPPGLPQNPAFSQGVSVEGNTRTIYVGGQNPITADGQVVGDDVAAQTVAALRNVERVLAAGGAKLTDVVTWSIALVEGQDARAGFGAFREVWGDHPDPPAISVAFVAGLGNPAWLVEITAVAVVDV